jgi:hypothetical protein
MLDEDLKTEGLETSESDRLGVGKRPFGRRKATVNKG